MAVAAFTLPPPLSRDDLIEVATRYASDIDTDEDREYLYYLARGVLDYARADLVWSNAVADGMRSIADLQARLDLSHSTNQRLTHERDRLREQLGTEVCAQRNPSQYELTVFCNTKDCPTPPLRIAKAPPDDAVGLWIRGMGWATEHGWAQDEEHYCHVCKEGR